MSLFCVRGQRLLQSHWHTAIYTAQNEITQAWRRLEKLSLAILGSLIPFLHLSLLLPFSFLISYGGSSWVLCSVAYWDYSLNGFNSSSIKLPTFFPLQVAFSEISKLSQFLKGCHEHWLRICSRVRIFPYRFVNITSPNICWHIFLMVFGDDSEE